MDILVAVGIGVFCVCLDKVLDVVINHYRHRRTGTSPDQPASGEGAGAGRA